MVDITNEELRGNRRRAQSELTSADQSIEPAGHKLTRLYASLEGGKVDLDGLAPRLKQLRAEQRALDEGRDQVLAETNEPAGMELDLANIQQYAGEIRAVLESSACLERKTFLGSFMREGRVRAKRRGYRVHGARANWRRVDW